MVSLLRDGPGAEEVTATAFERAYRKRSRFDRSRGEPRAWLFGIARNAALDELRRRGRQAELGAEPVDVSTAAVDQSAEESERRLAAYDGIVLKSSTSNGSQGEAGAEFDLLIPSAKLGDALAAFSGIAEVRSRHEATNDITAPTVGLGERLQDANAKIDGLLNELAGSDTEAERTTVEAELRAERSRAAVLRSRLTTLQRRASFSRVSLRIEAGTGSTSSSKGGWGIDDALSDAVRILAIAAGVAIVGLAILAPLALIGFLIWRANRARGAARPGTRPRLRPVARV
ncbi:MAG TPA: DUF4349 domain-containing protein [Solirubrobacterales bacterium]|nr:DUF4349 domain-containing protein [Solirubrobacterales bacterium]